jgi:hypothetical protein
MLFSGSYLWNKGRQGGMVGTKAVLLSARGRQGGMVATRKYLPAPTGVTAALVQAWA